MSETIEVEKIIKRLEEEIQFESKFLSPEDNRLVVAGLTIAKKIITNIANGEDDY